MTVMQRFALGAAVLVWTWAGPAPAQVCMDRDGDLASAGLGCADATDCDDGLWNIRPGVPEVCDGFDTDCNGAIDETCDRFCDAPDLYDFPRMFEFGENYPLELFYTTEAWEFFPGGVLGLAETGTMEFRALKLRAFDVNGRPLGMPQTLDAVTSPMFFEQEIDITWGAGHNLVLWYRDPPAGEPKYLLARVVDRFGAPIGPILDISALSGGRAVRAVTEWVGAFNGSEFAVFWTPQDATNELLMTMIGLDGQPESVRTVLVTDDADGKRSHTTSVRSIWTGDRYVVTLTAGESADVVTMAVDSAGTIVSGPFVHGLNSYTKEIVQTDAGPVAIMIEGRSTYDLIRLAFLDPMTGDLRGPGPNPVLLGSSELLTVSGARLTWNGEMLGVAASARHWNGQLYEHAIWFWRVLPDGTVLDPQGIKLDDGANWREPGIRKIGWDGEHFQIMGKFANFKLARATVVCNCDDADGDQFVACSTDCDDSDPAVNTLATEICTGGVDDDCDFLVDCADPDCETAAPAPSPVPDLAWTADGLAWTPGGDAQRWDLARGLLSDALRRGDFELAECAGRELTTPSWPDDGREPPLGDVLWYLVRPVGEPCARGPWSADGTPRETLVCD